MSGFFARRRRRRIRAQPVPDAWRRIIERNVPAFARHPREEQDAWIGHAQVLLAEKNWEGCGGLVLNDEIRVTIAMHAARLLLELDADYFPTVRSILVYPTDVVRTEESHVGHGIWREGEDTLSGLSAGDLNAIVLSWSAVRSGIRDPGDGFNVVLHEFAHELDYEDGAFDGAPLLASGDETRRWAGALGAAYDALRADVEAGKHTFLDPYGATNPAEFFAVLTETFFERPVALRHHLPDVYAELREFYGQDPAALA